MADNRAVLINVPVHHQNNKMICWSTCFRFCYLYLVSLHRRQIYTMPPIVSNN